MAPRLALSRASCSSAGRNRLPTWSARKGGLVRWVIEDSRENRLTECGFQAKRGAGSTFFSPPREWEKRGTRASAASEGSHATIAGPVAGEHDSSDHFP